MLPLVAIALALSTSAGPVPDARGPTLFGGLGSRIREQEREGIAKALGGSSSAIALYAHRSQPPPCTWYADVFLSPARSVAGARLVRGSIAHLECVPEADASGCSQWRTRGRP